MGKFFSSLCDLMCNGKFWLGFAIGAGLLLLGEAVVWIVKKMRKRMEAIVIHDQGGDFLIGRKAFLEFLRSVASAIDGVTLKDVILIRRPEDKVRVDLLLSLSAKADLEKVHKELRPMVLAQAAKKLGVADRIEVLNLVFKRVPSPGKD